ncbi:MAG: hypothetical protein HZC04_00190 [Candidatus Lloydbacteria bacterium]|nr:hypothetical protein [Candidatus Lloydbacteria bacterium]
MSKKMKILGLAALIVLAIGIASLYKAYNYVEHNVNFCQSCHVMERAFYTWQKNAHKGVNCKVCHTQDMPGRMAMALRAVVGKEDVGPHAKLDKTVCEQCHLKTNATVTKNVLGTIGHEKHVVKNGIQCVTCHFGKLHNTKTTAENCQTCHMKSRIEKTSGMSDLSCTDCHAFLAKTKDTGSLKPTKESCLTCHEEKNVSPTKSPMQFECAVCHKPHTTSPTITPVNCMSQCHVSVIGNKKHSERGIFKGNKVASCTTCHPAHTWKVN